MLQHNKPTLMYTDEGIEDVHDFLNYSLSSGHFSLQRQRDLEGKVVSQNSMNSSKSEQLNSDINSPKTDKLIINSKHSTSQKSNACLITDTANDKTYSNLIQYFFIKRFLHAISWKKKLNSMFNKYHYDVINDKASQFDIRLFQENAMSLKPIIQKPPPVKKRIIQETYQQSKQHMYNIYNKCQVYLNKIPLIYPESRLKIIWDVVIMISRFYFMFVIPLDLSWVYHQFMFDILLTPTLVMMILLITDYLMSFNNAYYESGQIVTSRSKIATHVITRSYGVELLSVFLLLFFLIFVKVQDAQLDITNNWYFLLLSTFLVQYQNITKLTEQVEEAMNLSKPSSSLLELMKLILLVFYVLHIFTCLWFWAGSYSTDHDGKSWLLAKEMIDQPWEVQYLYSFYFSTVTMFTVGYGDITPQTQVETLISIAFMMICSIQLSYSVSTVSAIIDKISFYSKDKMKKVQTINTYMQNKNISYQLQFQIREYLNYYWQASNQEETEEEKDIIGQLSENLRGRLMFEANSMILSNCPLFKNYFSEQLKRKLVSKIRQVVVQPENVIDFDRMFADNKNQLFICFIESGSIEIFVENEMQKGNNLTGSDVSTVSKIPSGSSLGIMSFITGIKAPERFRSVGFTKLLLLARDDFMKIIVEYPEDYELFREMHDDLLYNPEPKFLKMSCFSCSSMSHRAISCPLLHFRPDIELLIKRHQYSRDQERNEHSKNMTFLRNPFRQAGLFSALTDLDIVQESAQLCSTDNIKAMSIYDIDEQEPTTAPPPELEPVQLVQPDSHLSNQNNTSLTSSSSYKRMSSSSTPKQQASPRLSRQSVRFTNQLMQITEENAEEYEDINQKQEQSSKSTLKSLTKKSQSMQVDQKLSAQSTGLMKLRRAMGMIKGLGTMQKQKPNLKAQFKNLISSMHQPIFKEISLEQQLAILEKRMLKMEEHRDIFPVLLYSQTETLRMKYRMLIELQDVHSELRQFETVKHFKQYYQQNNLEEILYKQETYYLPQIQQLPNFQGIFPQLVKYLQYPYNYIEKYKFKQEYQKSKTKMKKLQTFKQVAQAVSHRQSRAIIKKNKRNQIAPQPQFPIVERSLQF